MAITHSYVDYGAGSDATGDGTIGTPWKTLQKAFDTLTRNTTDGNQVNLKAGTAHVNAAALDLTTFIAGGALAAAAPLILRGYTSAANDGGIGEIDCGGYALWAGDYAYFVLVDLEIHTFGNNDGISSGGYGCCVHHCEVHKGASTPSSKALIKFTGDFCNVVGCYVHDAHTNGVGISLSGDASLALSNYVVAELVGITGANADGFSIIGNVVLCNSTSAYAIIVSGTSSFWIIGNIAYSAAAGTGPGINLGNYAGRYAGVCINNIAVGWSGAGSIGIGSATAGVYAYLVGYNAFYNNTTGFSLADTVFIDLTANDVTLAADPFTDAANGDFSLTAAAKTALAAKGWPTSYLGAHANTVPNLNIGPIQMAAGSGGGVYRAVMRTLGG
jgi:hypothetical protein